MYNMNPIVYRSRALVALLIVYGALVTTSIVYRELVAASFAEETTPAEIYHVPFNVFCCSHGRGALSEGYSVHCVITTPDEFNGGRGDILKSRKPTIPLLQCGNFSIAPIVCPSRISRSNHKSYLQRRWSFRRWSQQQLEQNFKIMVTQTTLLVDKQQLILLHIQTTLQKKTDFSLGLETVPIKMLFLKQLKLTSLQTTLLQEISNNLCIAAQNGYHLRSHTEQANIASTACMLYTLSNTLTFVDEDKETVQSIYIAHLKIVQHVLILNRQLTALQKESRTLIPPPKFKHSLHSTSPDGEVFQSTPKGVLMTHDLGGLSSERL